MQAGSRTKAARVQPDLPSRPVHDAFTRVILTCQERRKGSHLPHRKIRIEGFCKSSATIID